MKKSLFLPILLGTLLLTAVWAEAKKIAVYHTSDIHGYYFSRLNKAGQKGGGFAVLESLLQKEKLPFILLDSGDFSSGNQEANASEGRYSVMLMNRAGKSPLNFKGAGYTALTIGNHDSDFGDEKLARTLAAFEGDILSVNLEGLHITGKPVKTHAVYEVGGIKLAVIGFSLDGPGMRGMKLKKLNGKDLQALFNAVEADKPDAVILLAHDSAADARKPSSLLPLLQGVPLARRSMNVFLGGHAHILNNSHPWGENGPLFVESGSMLEGVSRVEIETDDKTGRFVRAAAQYIALFDPDIKEDPATAALLERLEDKSLEQPYAFVPAPLPKYPAKGDAAAALARRVAQQMYDWVKQRENIDFAMFQLPGIRRDLAAGMLTGRDMAELLPYTEYVSTFDITGKQLKKAVAQSIKRDAKGDYSMFSYSDNVRIKYKYNAKNKKNPVKITSMTIDGRKVKNSRIYRTAAIAHIPRGFFEGAPFKVENPNQRIYEDKTSGGLLFDAVKALPGQSAREKELRAPQDVQIRLLN